MNKGLEDGWMMAGWIDGLMIDRLDGWADYQRSDRGREGSMDEQGRIK